MMFVMKASLLTQQRELTRIEADKRTIVEERMNRARLASSKVTKVVLVQPSVCETWVFVVCVLHLEHIASKKAQRYQKVTNGRSLHFLHSYTRIRVLPFAR
jgi:hypothetical protein